MSALLKIESNEAETALRNEFAERITGLWHRCRGATISMGRAIIEAKQQLPAGQFAAMLEHDLPFSADSARRFMRIALDPKLANPATLHVLPESYAAMDHLRRLSDEQFEQGLATGVIRVDMTVKDAAAFVRELRQAEPHRPRHNEIPQPSAPIGALTTSASQSVPARSYSEMVWLLVQRRQLLGFTQLDLDARVGWPEGLTGKLEIPHMQEGRMAGHNTLKEWWQALGVGFQMVAV